MVQFNVVTHHVYKTVLSEQLFCTLFLTVIRNSPLIIVQELEKAKVHSTITSIRGYFKYCKFMCTLLKDSRRTKRLLILQKKIGAYIGTVQ